MSWTARMEFFWAVPDRSREGAWLHLNRSLGACLVSLRPSDCIAARIQHAGCMHGGCESALHRPVWICRTDPLHAGGGSRRADRRGEASEQIGAWGAGRRGQKADGALLPGRELRMSRGGALG